jgi:hypothetical protein
VEEEVVVELITMVGLEVAVAVRLLQVHAQLHLECIILL